MTVKKIEAYQSSNGELFTTRKAAADVDLRISVEEWLNGHRPPGNAPFPYNEVVENICSGYSNLYKILAARKNEEIEPDEAEQ